MWCRLQCLYCGLGILLVTPVIYWHVFVALFMSKLNGWIDGWMRMMHWTIVKQLDEMVEHFVTVYDYWLKTGGWQEHTGSASAASTTLQTSASQQCFTFCGPTTWNSLLHDCDNRPIIELVQAEVVSRRHLRTPSAAAVTPSALICRQSQTLALTYL